MSLNRQLIEAAENGDLEMTKNKSDFRAQSCMDRKFIQAAQDGDYRQVKQLLLADANIHASEGWLNPDAAFIKASEYGHETIVDLLIDPPKYGINISGANIHVLNDLALSRATQHGHENIVRLLIDLGADIHQNNYNSLLVAIDGGHEGIIRLLIEEGANIQADNNFCLRRAAYLGHLSIVKLLLDPPKGPRADINAFEDDDDNRGVLSSAAWGGNEAVVHLLLEPFKYGLACPPADIHQENDYALQMAAFYGHIKIVHFLVDHGADIRAENDLAYTFAARNNHFRIIDLFLNPGKYGLKVKSILQPKVHFKSWPKIRSALQILKQEESYSNARVMYYVLTFARQADYNHGQCGALIQALDMSLT